MPQEGVGQSNEKVLGGLYDAELKGLFALFWNGECTVETSEVAAQLSHPSSIYFIVLQVRGLLVNDEFEGFAISLPFLKELGEPHLMVD